MNLNAFRATNSLLALGPTHQGRYQSLEAEDGLWGPAWEWALAPVWWSVNLVALKVFGQDRHCQASVGSFMVPENAP